MATRGRPRKVQAEEQIDVETEDVVTEEVEVKEEVVASDSVVYETAGEETTSFDILLAGEYVKSNWNKERTKFSFNVPMKLVARMEAHHHVVTGRIVRRD